MTLPLALLVAGSFLLHRHLLGHHVPAGALIAWFSVLAISLLQCTLSWLARAYAGPVPGGRVAVVVPCYNEDAALLVRVLESIRQQTLLPDEVIVVDDGSTASYADVISRFPDVTWLRQENREKHAQAAGFRHAPWADFYVTIDSTARWSGAPWKKASDRLRTSASTALPGSRWPITGTATS